MESFLADVADERQVMQAARRAVDAFGRLDVLVSNAAMRNYSALAEASTEESGRTPVLWLSTRRASDYLSRL